MLTQWRIRLLANDTQACFRTLERSDVSLIRAPQRPIVNGCGYRDGVAPAASSLDLQSPPVMRCALAAAYAAWELQVVAPAARRHLGSDLESVRHLGVYSCRDIAGRAGRRSQHATANAIDVSGFTLSDGRVVTLRRDWNNPGPAGRFLR
ncbi:hypothetical protein GCM10008179_00970 [Hansschlegelia plantiphila]|uniref:Extensin-like C-terminal domain-containing protein n=1 Tax=Hansschlegelia plantiphila TaxID=374655 RepID=A0A9W6MTL7_9HYPH|nr:hypothetical protein GCM10008179_00970 [Hansschlegelia plantiphila]